MDNTLDLALESLDAIEAPLSDFEGGLICGALFGIGVIVGAAIVLT